MRIQPGRHNTSIPCRQETIPQSAAIIRSAGGTIPLIVLTSMASSVQLWGGQYVITGSAGGVGVCPFGRAALIQRHTLYYGPDRRVYILKRFESATAETQKKTSTLLGLPSFLHRCKSPLTSAHVLRVGVSPIIHIQPKEPRPIITAFHFKH